MAQNANKSANIMRAVPPLVPTVGPRHWGAATRRTAISCKIAHELKSWAFSFQEVSRLYFTGGIKVVFYHY